MPISKETTEFRLRAAKDIGSILEEHGEAMTRVANEICSMIVEMVNEPDTRIGMLAAATFRDTLMDIINEHLREALKQLPRKVETGHER